MGPLPDSGGSLRLAQILVVYAAASVRDVLIKCSSHHLRSRVPAITSDHVFQPSPFCSVNRLSKLNLDSI
jgi:hypothetical protein